MTVERDYVRVGSMGPGPLNDLFKCRKCECLVTRPSRKAHTMKVHAPKTFRRRGE